jgi:serine/threonine-protein kinase
VLIRGGGNAKYADSGNLIYAVAGALLAVPFDVSTREVHGDPTPQIERVMSEGTFASAPFAVSSTGTLVYVPGGPGSLTTRSLVWVNRQGQEQAIEAPVRAYTLLRLSPDGTRVALDIRDQQNDIWIWDLARHTLAPLTFDPATDRNPVWTPDGRHIIFTSTRDGAFSLYWQAADGTGSAERLTTSTPGSSFQLPMAVSSDGTRMVLNMNGDIGLLPLKGGGIAASRLNETGQGESHPTPSQATVNSQSQGPQPLFRTPVTEDNAELSPDGRWLAYQSAESGVPQIYVRPFPNVNDGRWQVSTISGVKPAWARNGRELFYVAPGSAFMAVPITPSTTTFVAGNPVKLFNAPYYFSSPNRTYDVSLDGQRFLMIKEKASSDRASSASPDIVVVLNWFEELKQRVAVR